jgi:hypothetical protein
LDLPHLTWTRATKPGSILMAESSFLILASLMILLSNIFFPREPFSFVSWKSSIKLHDRGTFSNFII